MGLAGRWLGCNGPGPKGAPHAALGHSARPARRTHTLRARASGGPLLPLDLRRCRAVRRAGTAARRTRSHPPLAKRRETGRAARLTACCLHSLTSHRIMSRTRRRTHARGFFRSSSARTSSGIRRTGRASLCGACRREKGVAVAVVRVMGRWRARKLHLYADMDRAL
jgi:hypothetical protein